MKIWKNIKLILILAVLAFAYNAGYSQEAVQEVIEVVKERPMYERFGMTSTGLFALMLGFTILLLFILLGLAHSLRNIAAMKLRDKTKNGAKMILLLFGLFSGVKSFAAEPFEQESMNIPFPDEAFWAFLTVDIVLVLIIIFFARLSNSLLYDFVPKRESRWARKFQKSLTDATPIEDEASILMDHDYDGIRELDNNLPPWWKWGFYITIVWAIGYLFYYMLPGGGLSQEEEFNKEWEDGLAAVAQYKADHPELVTAESAQYLTDANTLGMGSSIFTEKCVTCHKAGGAGESGPNLTDDYWINGQPTMENIFNVISNGAANGMKAWKNDLNGVEIQAVASYVLSLEPINPPEGQEPKGDYYSPDQKEQPASPEAEGEEEDAAE